MRMALRQLRQAALNEGRGRSPGNTTAPAPRPSGMYALNEGRGRSPGNT